MPHDRFDQEAFEQRVLSSLERREARQQATAPPTLVQRLLAIRRQGQKLRTLPRV